jgi:TRAP-type C4-dicarboxylate transport system permease small subunit
VPPRDSRPDSHLSLLRALFCLGSAALLGAGALFFDHADQPAWRASTAGVAPSYLPADNSGIIRMVLVIGMVLLILGQLWILQRRLQPRQVLVPVQSETRRNRSGSSSTSPNESTLK